MLKAFKKTLDEGIFTFVIGMGLILDIVLNLDYLTIFNFSLVIVGNYL